MASKENNSYSTEHIHSNAEPLPVTVLSGFLGSGKTTLLRHILSNHEHGLRIAVIVNDMAAINVDAAHIARFSPMDDSKLVQMENGCICCTLRGDLLTELARLAWSGKFDSVVIESSGISEPQQVAETFTVELSEAMVTAEGMSIDDRKVLDKVAKLGGLQKLAKLDTMVTVVDAFRFFSEFDTPEFLTDRFGRDEVPEEDQRTISDLFTEQIEFANVIVLNKIDIIDHSTRGRVKAYIKALNPHARILESKYAKVDVKEMLKTGQFNFGDAVAMAGWLSSLQEMTVRDVAGKTRLAPKPETLEYGIGSFIYSARKPFDPHKLYKAIRGKFILRQDEYETDEEEEEDDDNYDDEGDDLKIKYDSNGNDITNSFSEHEVNFQIMNETDNETAGDDWGGFSDDEDKDWRSTSNTTVCSSEDVHSPHKLEEDENDVTVILNKKRTDPLFKGLHRSKGAIWFATRPQCMGGWSSAGAMLTINYQAPWFCTIPDDNWGADEETRKSIKRDFKGAWGDRRQEIVFIGENLDQKGLKILFDSCLLTDREMQKWEKVMYQKGSSVEEKQEALQQLWNDEFWAEWGVEGHNHCHASDEDSHHHAHHHDQSNKKRKLHPVE